MKYTINYSNLSIEEAESKALQDIQAYLTEEQHKKLVEFLAATYHTSEITKKVGDEEEAHKATEQKVNFACMLLGIEGFPCSVLLKLTLSGHFYSLWLEIGKEIPDPPLVRTDEARKTEEAGESSK